MSRGPEAAAAKRFAKDVEGLAFRPEWFASCLTTQAESSVAMQLRYADCFHAVYMVWADWYVTGYVKPGDALYGVCQQAYRFVYEGQNIG